VGTEDKQNINSRLQRAGLCGVMMGDVIWPLVPDVGSS